MSLLSKLLAAASLALSTAAHAGLISGFENGMQGWEYIGDVSVQNASIGLNPTQGHNLVFLTTISTTGEITTPEYPYSGTNSPPSYVAREFLGLKTDDSLASYQHIPGLAESSYSNMRGESAAIKTQFTANRPGFLSFDWDRIGTDPDNAYFTIWNDDLGNRVTGWVYFPDLYTGGFTPVSVGLCSQIQIDQNNPACDYFFGRHTGWHTMDVWIGTPGTYSIGFGMGEIAEGTVPTVLALDNIRFNVVPEPDSLALIGLAIAGLAFGRRCKT